MSDADTAQAAAAAAAAAAGTAADAADIAVEAAAGASAITDVQVGNSLEARDLPTTGAELSATLDGRGDARYAKTSSPNTLSATTGATLRTQGGSTLDDGNGNMATKGRVQVGTDATWGNIPTLRQVEGRSSGRVSIQSHQAATGTGGMELQLIPDTNVDPATTPTTQILLFNRNGFNYERFIQGFTTNIYTLASTAGGAGVPRNIVFSIGGYAELNNVPGANAIQIRNDGSVDLLAAQYNVTTGVIPPATTVASFVSPTQITLSAPPVALEGWPAGTTYVTSVVVGATPRVVTNCTLTAGSTTVTTTGAFTSGDVGTAITSRSTYATNQTRFVDPANTGRSTPILDTRTGSPSSSPSDRAYFQYRRGGSTKWLAGLNPSGSNTDSFEIQDVASGNVGLRIAPGGVASFPNGVAGFNTALARKVHNPSTRATYTTSAVSLTAVDTTNLTVSFVAPSSGSVTLRTNVLAYISTGSFLMHFGLLDHTSGTQVGAMQTATGSVSAMHHAMEFDVTGLTPGATYQYDLAWCMSSASAVGNLQAGIPSGVTQTAAPASLTVVAA